MTAVISCTFSSGLVMGPSRQCGPRPPASRSSIEALGSRPGSHYRGPARHAGGGSLSSLVSCGAGPVTTGLTLAPRAPLGRDRAGGGSAADAEPLDQRAVTRDVHLA